MVRKPHIRSIFLAQYLLQTMLSTSMATITIPFAGNESKEGAVPTVADIPALGGILDYLDRVDERSRKWNKEFDRCGEADTSRGAASGAKTTRTFCTR